MGDNCSKKYYIDEDPPSPRRVQYTRSRFTTLTGNKKRRPVNKDIWSTELINLIKEYKDDVDPTTLYNLYTSTFKGILTIF